MNRVELVPISLDAKDLYKKHGLFSSNLEDARQKVNSSAKRMDSTSNEFANTDIQFDDGYTRSLKNDFGDATQTYPDDPRFLDGDLPSRATVISSRAKTDLKKASKNYKDNISAGADHYAAKKDAYHQMAIEEAEDRKKKIKFIGDIAINVRLIAA